MPVYNSRFPNFSIFFYCRKLQEDVPFWVLVLVYPDLIGVLLFCKNCLLEQTHQDIYVAEILMSPGVLLWA